MHIGVLWLVLFPGAVLAITIQSTFLETFLANGTQGPETQWQQQSITFACSNRDSEDSSLQQSNIYYDVLCQPPRYSFGTTLRQFIPHKFRRYTAEMCEMVQGTTTYDTGLPNTTQSGTQVFESSRRLLSFFDDAWDDISSAASTAWNFLASPPCDSPWGDLVDVGLIVAGTATGVTPLAAVGVAGLVGSAANSNQCGGGGGGPVSFNPNVIDTQINTLTLLAQWEQQQQLVDATIAKSDVDAVKAVNQTQRAILATQKILVNLNQTVGVMAQAIDTDFSNIQGRLEQFENDLDTYLLGQEGLNLQEQQFENQTTANFRVLASAMKQLAANISDDLYELVNINLLGQQQTEYLGVALTNAFDRVGVRYALTLQVFQLALEALADGLTPFWDPAFSGKAPITTLTPAQRTLFVDVQYVNYISGEPTPTVTQFEIAYYCNAVYVIGAMVPQPTWMDILSQLGPSGCTELPGNTVDNCNCWVQVNQQQCQANVGGRDNTPCDFNWQQIPLPPSNLDAFLLESNPAYCFGEGGASERISNGPWNGQLIDNVALWNALQADLCNVQLSPAITPSGSCPAQTRQMQLVSTRVGIVNVEAPSNPAVTCQPNYAYTFNVASVEYNIVFSIVAYMIQAQTLLLDDQTEYESLVYGILPNYLTYEELPFQVLSNNRSYSCHRASFIAVSDDTRPVFQLTPQGFSPVVSINGYSSPPVCDSTGCVFDGSPVLSEITSDVVTSVPFAYLLPTASDTVVGEWRTRGIPTMITIFNMPEGAAPVNNVNADRSGTATYVWQPIAAGYSISAQTSYQEDLPQPSGPWPQSTLLDEWNLNNPTSFSSFEASISADLGEVLFVDGQCAVNPVTGEVKEWACLMFDHYELDPLTDMRNGLLVLVPDEWNYIVTMNIPTGELIQRVFQGCPEFEFYSYTNGYQELFITNSLPNPVAVQVTFTLDLDVCPPIASMTYTLQPKQIQSQIIYGCPSATLNVYAIGADGLLTVCEGTRNISYAPGAQGNVPYFTDDTTLAPVLSSAILDQYVQSQQNLLNVLQAAVPYMVPSFTPELTTTQRSDALTNLFAGLNATLYAQLAEAQSNPGPSVSASIAPLVAQLAGLQNQLTTINAAVAAASNQLSDDAGTLKLQVGVQSVLTNETVAAIQAEIAADQQEIQQIVNAGGDSTAQCTWCSDWLSPSPPALSITNPSTFLSNIAAPVGSTIGSFICPILCSLLQLLIGAAIIVALLCCCIQCGPALCKGLCGLCSK